MVDKSFLTPEEIYLFNNGNFYHAFLKFGAHKVCVENQDGVHFSVWAPNARRASVVGNFNRWQGHLHRMKRQGESGVWTLFIPGIDAGEIYKYEIETQNGTVVLKADPFAFYAEMRPKTASIVYELGGFEWHDEDWMLKRARQNSDIEPVLIYEVHLGSWKRNPDDTFYSYRQLADEMVGYVKLMGFTHLELMPLMEHPYDGSWGYQITGYYSATSRYGTPHDLMYLIDKCHQAGIAVILDWVPGHFCMDAHGLGKFDGSSLYDKEEHPEWGTYKFDFGRMEVWSFLISNAIYWFDLFHVDGLRVDGVTSMLYSRSDTGIDKNKRLDSETSRTNFDAVAFLGRLHNTVYYYYPSVLMVAEESTDWPYVTKPVIEGGLGFNYKWNMGWMNDTLKYFENHFSKRKERHHLLTFSMTYAYSERFILPLSHDEVVHGKKSLIGRMPGDLWQKFAGLRTLYLYQISHPGKKLLFMGDEIAQFVEWRYDSAIEWFLLKYEMHNKFQKYVRDANQIYLQEPGLWKVDNDWQGFEWIDVNNCDQGIFIFLRRSSINEEFLIVLINCLPHGYEDYRIGVPYLGKYKEILNSDESQYGGSHMINPRVIDAEEVPWHGQRYSISLKVPPLGGVIVKPSD